MPGCTCLACAVLRLGGDEQDVAGAERVVAIIVGRDPQERDELANAILADTRWILPSARTLVRYAKAVRRSTTGIEIQLPPPVSPQLLRRFNEPLPVESARQVPILSVLERIGIGHVRKVGREYVSLCPFHDDSHPSFRVNAERGLWYCDPCGIGGDAINLIMRVRGCSFSNAVLETIR